MRARAPALLAPAVWAIAACSGAPQGLAGSGDPLVVIHGHLTGALPAGVLHPRAAVLWAGTPVFVPYCYEHGWNPLIGRLPDSVGQSACRNPFEVVPALPGPSVAIDPAGGDFEIPLEHLPDAQVMIGKLPSRVAYGALIVFDDVNDDHAFTFTQACFRDMGRDSMIMSPENGAAPDAPPGIRETIYASSFESLQLQQTRITYVEGPFDADSYYYPHPQKCTALPGEGFSIWHLGSVLEPEASCSLEPIDAPIELSTRSEAEHYISLIDLTCTQRTREAFPRPPPDRPPSKTAIFECWKGSIVLTDPACICPNIRIYSLSGCYADDACPNPDWSLPAPPEWPCPVPNEGGT